MKTKLTIASMILRTNEDLEPLIVEVKVTFAQITLVTKPEHFDQVKNRLGARLDSASNRVMVLFRKHLVVIASTLK